MSLRYLTTYWSGYKTTLLQEQIIFEIPQSNTAEVTFCLPEAKFQKQPNYEKNHDLRTMNSS